MRRLITILICCAAAAPPAFCAVRKVPQQYPTINAAVTAANNGDVIKIAKGRYQEAVATTKRLTFEGVNGTIWDGFYSASHHDQLDATANNVTVKGIEFQNGLAPIAITGNNALVTDCVFNGSGYGVNVEGAGAEVSHNLFKGLYYDVDTIVILGADAVVDRNEVIDGYSAWISVDAGNGGTATVTNNVMNTNQYYAHIAVSNAAAPLIKKNKVLNTYASDSVIDVTNCDDAEVSGNTLCNINYDVYEGIYVQGERALVTKNTIENLHCYADEITCIWVEGDDARVTRNKVLGCGAGEDYDTYGIYVDGSEALVEKNLVEDLGGGGNNTYGIEVDGADMRVAKNTVRNINDEYGLGIYLYGDRARVEKNKVSNVMYWPLLEVDGNDFRIEDNVLKDGAYNSGGLDVEGVATSPGAAVIRSNTVNNIAGYGMYLGVDGVNIQGNSVKHTADEGIYLYGANNVLKDNKVSNTLDDSYYVDGTGNSFSKCTAQDASRDGFDIIGDLNSLDKCKVTNCAAEGLDNGDGTNTTATDCVLKGSRIDYAGDGGMASDTGTTYQTGGAGVAPEID